MTLLEVTEAEKVEVMGDDPDELPLRSAAFTFFSPFLNYFVYLFFSRAEKRKRRERGEEAGEVARLENAKLRCGTPFFLHKIEKKTLRRS